MDVSHELRSWLNDEAPWNTAYKLVTDSVLHPSGVEVSGWLKLVAKANMPPMLVTALVSQLLMLLLNDEAPSKAELRSVVPARSGASVAVAVRLDAPEK